GCREPLCYPRDGIGDIQAAMNALEAAVGTNRFVLAGLCSGGDLTFQTALRDPRVVGAVIINPRTFCVNDLELVDTYKRARYYFDSFRDPQKLLRLIRGDVMIGRAIRMMLANVRRIWQRKRATQSASGTLNDVPACLRLMANGGVDTLLVVSEHDPGVEYVDHHFARGMR